jgi:tetratricopeptide (TPR) repeat protein
MTPTAKARLVALAAVCTTVLAVGIAPQSSIALQLAYFLALFVVVIPLHELGHAIAGAFVGFRIMGIVVGAGPPLADFRWRGVNVQINLLPLGGVTMAVPKRTYRSLRLRQWILTAGGPVANVLIYLALWRVFGPALRDSEHHPFAWAAAQVAATTLFFNLIPFRTAEGAVSDGYGLATIPFWSKERIAVSNLLQQGHILHRERRHEDARTIWREALGTATDSRQIAMLKNNIAWATVLIGRDEELAEADQLSQQALAALPGSPPIAGTRAGVLIRLGRPGEALPLLALSDSALHDPHSRAYNKALAASALAALGRHDDAIRRLAEARRADPACELIPRAEADVAAGPTGALAAPTPLGPTADPLVLAAALRPWRRDARILAFLAIFVVLERLGVDLAPFAILIVLSFAPELGGALALAGYGLSAALLHGVGLIRPPFAVDAHPAPTVALTFAVGAVACWLVVRHHRIGPPPRSRIPTVLGWILASLTFLILLPELLGLLRDRSPLAIHASALAALRLTPGLIGLALLLASRRRRGVRLLAIGPVAVALLAVAPGSGWYLNRVALAEIPAAGAPMVLSELSPAKIVRSARLSTRSDTVTVSPGGRAFFVADRVGPRSRRLEVSDFDGHLVAVAGTAAAFVDDERLLVLRPGAEPDADDVLVELRPFHGPEPVWTKPVGDIDIHDAAIHVDRDTGAVFIVAGSEKDDAPATLRTTLAPDTPVDASPLGRRYKDSTLAVALPTNGWGGMLVARTTGWTTDLVWRTPGNDRRLVSRMRAPSCTDSPAGSALIWCFAPRVPVLLLIDARDGSVTRVPGEVRGGWGGKMLGPSTMAILHGGELHVLDLAARRGTRLKLPENKDADLTYLADGALAILARSWQGSDATLTVYANTKH